MVVLPPRQNCLFSSLYFVFMNVGHICYSCFILQQALPKCFFFIYCVFVLRDVQFLKSSVSTLDKTSKETRLFAFNLSNFRASNVNMHLLLHLPQNQNFHFHFSLMELNRRKTARGQDIFFYLFDGKCHQGPGELMFTP